MKQLKEQGSEKKPHDGFHDFFKNSSKTHNEALWDSYPYIHVDLRSPRD